ncbi:MAG: conjugal transfer protein TraF [Nitrospiraceae bacterium]
MLVVVGGLSPAPVLAVEFTIVGPRAVGMGGAGVAVTTDALATYWNPAGLAMSRTIDIRVQASGQITDRQGIADTLEEIDNINLNDVSGANQGRLQGLLNKLNQPGTNVSAAGAAGIYLKGYWGDHAFGFNVSDVATGGAFVSSPVSFTQIGGALNVSGQLALRGLEARQAGFSYAYAFADRTLAIGATAKIIQGAAYSNFTNIRGSEGDVEFAADLGKAQISTAFGLDVGAIYRPSSWLRIGVVGKDLNTPTFDAPGGGEFKLLPQIRGGIAVNPYSSLTLTFDGDVTSNKTLLPGVKSRVFSLGAEQTLLSEFLSLRLGALKNVEDAKSVVTPTAGLGIRVFALRLDIGGGYDFRERGALASGSVSMTF